MLCFQPAAEASTVNLTMTGVVNSSSTAAKVPIGSFLSMTFAYKTDTPLYTTTTTLGGGTVATYTNAITAFSTTVTAPDGTTLLYSGSATGPFGYIRVINDNTTVSAGTYDVFQATINSSASDYSPAGAAGSNALPNTGIAYFDAQGAYNGFRSTTIRLPLLSTALVDTSIPSSIDFSKVNPSNPGTSFMFDLWYTYVGPSGPADNQGPIDIGANLTGLSVTAANVSAVPLPAALPLFAAGLGGFGLIGTRRRRQRQTPTA